MSPWCPRGPRGNQATSPQRSPLSDLTGLGCRTWLGGGEGQRSQRTGTKPGQEEAARSKLPRSSWPGRAGGATGQQSRGQGAFPEGRTPGWEMRREAAADGACPGPGCLNPSGERGTRSRAPMPLPYRRGVSKAVHRAGLCTCTPSLKGHLGGPQPTEQARRPHPHVHQLKAGPSGEGRRLGHAQAGGPLWGVTGQDPQELSRGLARKPARRWGPGPAPQTS